MGADERRRAERRLAPASPLGDCCLTRQASAKTTARCLRSRGHVVQPLRRSMLRRLGGVERHLSLAISIAAFDERESGWSKAVVLYGHPDDSGAFERHYAEKHTPLAEAIPGLRRFEAARGLATPDGSPVPNQRIADLTSTTSTLCRRGWRPPKVRPRSMTSKTSPPEA